MKAFLDQFAASVVYVTAIPAIMVSGYGINQAATIIGNTFAQILP